MIFSNGGDKLLLNFSILNIRNENVWSSTSEGRFNDKVNTLKSLEQDFVVHLNIVSFPSTFKKSTGFKTHFKILLQNFQYTHTHIYIYICVCVCVYIYNQTNRPFYMKWNLYKLL